MSNARLAVAALSLSMAGFVSITLQEGYTDSAVIPVSGDVPTVGFGSTAYENGKRVSMGDSIKPARAIQLAANHISKEERALRESLPGVALNQAEWDLYVDWVYQYGAGAWSRSSMRRSLLAGNYQAACDALLAYKFVAGFDCSTPGNKRCPGVWSRQVERHRKCSAAQ